MGDDPGIRRSWVETFRLVPFKGHRSRDPPSLNRNRVTLADFARETRPETK